MSDLLSDRRRKYVTIKELSEYFAISKTCAYDLVSSGEIHAKRIGRNAIRVHVDEVRRYEKTSEWRPREDVS